VFSRPVWRRRHRIAERGALPLLRAYTCATAPSTNSSIPVIRRMREITALAISSVCRTCRAEQYWKSVSFVVRRLLRKAVGTQPRCVDGAVKSYRVVGDSRVHRRNLLEKMPNVLQTILLTASGLARPDDHLRKRLLVAATTALTSDQMGIIQVREV
jgi:hypothetical protein